MTTRTITSDPAVALELGKRLALNAHRPRRAASRLGQVWTRWFARPAVQPAVVRHR